MKKPMTSILVMMLAMMVGATAHAQKKMKKGMKQMYSRTYNINTVETIDGTIADVRYMQSKKNKDMAGVHLLLKTDTESIPVHLGPAWYINRQKALEKGDKVVITGSRVNFEGESVIVAATVRQGEMMLKLREPDGIPMWRGWRKGNMMNINN